MFKMFILRYLVVVVFISQKSRGFSNILNVARENVRYNWLPNQVGK